MFRHGVPPLPISVRTEVAELILETHGLTKEFAEFSPFAMFL